MKQCRFTDDFCTCIYGRKVPKGACYGEYRGTKRRIPYICDDYRIVRGRLTIHVVDERDSLVIQKYGRRGFLRSYLYGKNMWIDIDVPTFHPLARMILGKAGDFQLCVERMPDSNQQYRKMRKPMHTRSWTRASHIKAWKTPEMGINAIPQTNGNGIVFTQRTDHESIWKTK